MNKMSKYLKHNDDSGYLPKEQLRRMMTFVNVKNDEIARRMGLSSNSLNPVKSFKSVTARFRKQHAIKLMSFRKKKSDVDLVSFRDDLASRGFLISYDDTTWYKRIGVARNYNTMIDYDVAVDNYLRVENPNPFIDRPDEAIIISLIEVAEAWFVKPHEVLEQIITEYHNEPADTDENHDDDEW